MPWPIVTMTIETESDVVAVRQRARRIAELLGFERQDQTRIATAVSEVARNAFVYAGGGRVEFLAEAKESPPLFRMIRSRTKEQLLTSANIFRRGEVGLHRLNFPRSPPVSSARTPSIRSPRSAIRIVN